MKLEHRNVKLNLKKSETDRELRKESARNDGKAVGEATTVIQEIYSLGGIAR
jgi:hypothetical protein